MQTKNMAPVPTHSERLKLLMTAAGISSYRALAARAGVSLWQIEQLRAGRGEHMRLTMLSRLAGGLGVSWDALLKTFELLPPDAKAEAAAEGELAAVRQEYVRLKGQMEEQVALGRSQLKTEALQTLESWLVQWPTIAQRAADNEALAAVKVLPFVRPVERLMEVWGVAAIAPVDAEIDYDPQRHQLMGGMAKAGEKVKVTHSGSLYEGKLLHRAKVKPI
ncbi:MAG: hypothetical protein DCF25_08685 [Leptolyngbya foveolarum]|uniref:HTH cro/C1-type domain-containing protein n=1 Tax=Leptolyngbya foveolarum TaxID=47253 RepID=A0A2W4UQR4_9CYAN|nr:MAG: hypothetical protein DCF25_08685 [Leptolyngbya foveolarum]